MAVQGKIVGFAIEEPGLNYNETVNRLRHEALYIPRRKALEAIEILGQQAEGLRRLSRLDDSQALFNKCLELSRESDASWRQCWPLWGLASVMRAKGHRTLSVQLYRSALSVARYVGDRRCELWSVAELSEWDRIAGQLQRAYNMHLILRREFHSIGDWKGVCWACLGIAQIYRLRREFEKAIAEFTRAHECSMEVGNRIGAAWAVRGQAEVARMSKNYTLSLELASVSRTSFLSIGYNLGAAYALKTQVDALIEHGGRGDIFAMAEQCKNEFIACGERRGIGFALLTLGQVCARLDQPLRAIRLLDRSRLLLAKSSGSEPIGFSPSAEIANIQDRLATSVGCMRRVTEGYHVNWGI